MSALLDVRIVLVIFYGPQNLVVRVDSSAQMVTRVAKGLKDPRRPVNLSDVPPRYIQSPSYLLLALRCDGNRLPRGGNGVAESSASDLVFKHRGIGRVGVLDIKAKRTGIEVDPLHGGTIERFIVRTEHLLEIMKRNL